MERLAAEAEEARNDVEARLAGMTASLEERQAALAAAAAEVGIQLFGKHASKCASAGLCVLLLGYGRWRRILARQPALRGCVLNVRTLLNHDHSR